MALSMKYFCFIFSLQTGCVLLSTVFLTLGLAVLFRNLPYLNNNLGTYVVLLFLLFLFSTALFTYFAAFAETDIMARFALFLTVGTTALWFVLALMPLFADKNHERTILRDACIRYRCGESLWLMDQDYRRQIVDYDKKFANMNYPAQRTTKSTNIIPTTTPPISELATRKPITTTTTTTAEAITSTTIEGPQVWSLIGPLFMDYTTTSIEHIATTTTTPEPTTTVRDNIWWGEFKMGGRVTLPTPPAFFPTKWVSWWQDREVMMAFHMDSMEGVGRKCWDRNRRKYGGAVWVPPSTTGKITMMETTTSLIREFDERGGGRVGGRGEGEVKEEGRGEGEGKGGGGEGKGKAKAEGKEEAEIGGRVGKKGDEVGGKEGGGGKGGGEEEEGEGKKGVTGNEGRGEGKGGEEREDGVRGGERGDEKERGGKGGAGKGGRKEGGKRREEEVGGEEEEEGDREGNGEKGEGVEKGGQGDGGGEVGKGEGVEKEGGGGKQVEKERGEEGEVVEEDDEGDTSVSDRDLKGRGLGVGDKKTTTGLFDEELFRNSVGIYTDVTDKEVTVDGRKFEDLDGLDVSMVDSDTLSTDSVVDSSVGVRNSEVTNFFEGSTENLKEIVSSDVENGTTENAKWVAPSFDYFDQRYQDTLENDTEFREEEVVEIFTEFNMFNEDYIEEQEEEKEEERRGEEENEKKRKEKKGGEGRTGVNRGRIEKKDDSTKSKNDRKYNVKKLSTHWKQLKSQKDIEDNETIIAGILIVCILFMFLFSCFVIYSYQNELIKAKTRRYVRRIRRETDSETDSREQYTIDFTK